MFGLQTTSYRAHDGYRFGVGPVGDSWREAIGVSVVMFGRGFAIYRLPRV